jgi:hypothetical protein
MFNCILQTKSEIQEAHFFPQLLCIYLYLYFFSILEIELSKSTPRYFLL